MGGNPAAYPQRELPGISPIPAPGRTLFTPKRRPFHGAARSVADCMNINDL